MVMRSKLLMMSFAMTALSPVMAAAQQADGGGGKSVAEVVVTAQRLDQARDSIQPQVGASTYTFNEQAIDAMPGGQNLQLNQVILQAPGVAQDSYGQLHIRGEHNGLQFRLDGVILPEGLSVFSQALSPRLADKAELITGALPAEYGLRTAGIIDITSKSGAAPGGEMSLYGGSHGDFEPSIQYGGTSGNFSYYVSGSYLQNGLGIESPDGRADPLHDQTRQFQGFAYLQDIIDPNSRVSLILGSSDQRFQIPDVSGQTDGGLGYTVNGQTSFPSEQLNENQTENTQYGVASYLHDAGKLTSQISLFARYSILNFTPDPRGDILYNGISQAAQKTDSAGGVQAETAYRMNDQHTLRAGVIVEIDRSTSNTTSQVLLINNNQNDPNFGSQISNQPFTIVDNSSKTAQTYSVYVQDEWKLLSNLTLNYGLRFDEFEGYRTENQVSPRINAVWKATDSITFHAGYARYFTPPPFELIGGQSVQKFVAPTGSPLVTSSAAPPTTGDTTPYAERADYYDIGYSDKLTALLTMTVDGYYKLSTHMIDEGQFGAPIILTPFNYQNGRQYGVEVTESFHRGPFSAYANFAYSVAQGENWITSQFNFDQPSLDYVAKHYIYLDHDQRYTASAGGTYTWLGTRFGADLIYGSGLHADLPLATPINTPDGPLGAIPNGDTVQPYTTVNLSISHKFETAAGGSTDVRFDVINVADNVYQIRNGSGVGVFAPQYGARRGFFVGLTKSF
jgi:outer membrane receptor for ferrienterochelin and colicins